MSTNGSVRNSTYKHRDITPRKRWGQHFLQQRHIAQHIIELLAAEPGDSVVEIGPGTGILTEHLLHLPIRVFAVELDERCIALLRDRFPSSIFPQLELICADILHYDLPALAERVLCETGRKLLVIGNVPYNISSPLLFRLFHLAPLLSRAVLMVQRELAQRLVARPGTRDYGILRLACWAVAEARLHFHVPPSAFVPPPAVVSSVVTLRFRPDAWTGAPYHGFIELLHAAFGQRRKQLQNALHRYIIHRCPGCTPERLLSRAGIEPRRRAEELSPEEFVTLYTRLTTECCDAHA